MCRKQRHGGNWLNESRSKGKLSEGRMILCFLKINLHLIEEPWRVMYILTQSQAGFIIEGETRYRHKLHLQKTSEIRDIF